MYRSRLLGSVLVLALATTACESDPLSLDASAQVADDELSSVLAAESGSSDPRGLRDNADRGESVFDRLAAQIPGFGGLYRSARCVVAVVLTAEADVQEAVRVVHDVVGPLVSRTCPDGIRVDPVRGQFTYVELRRFLLASRPLNNIPGVAGARIDFMHNRLVIFVTSRRVAHAVTQALPRVGIPERAVMFQPAGRTGRSVGSTTATG